MRVTLSVRDNVVTFGFEHEAGDRVSMVDPQANPDARLRDGECCYWLPPEWRFGDVHPDLFAAVAIAIAGDYVGRKLTVPVAVSTHLAERFAALYECELAPVDAALKPRAAPSDGRQGLCYSGGIDSTAALLLVPPRTVPVFLERLDPASGAASRLYDKEPALRACRVLRGAGWDAWAIRSNMEYLRRPVGFPNDLTMSTPLMLLADWLELDSVAYGLILESSYLDKAYKFRDYARVRHFTVYGGISEAVGLPWNLVTAGLSEVVTSRLVLESPYQHIAQSCIRGPFGEPCLNCWKCHRKVLLEACLAGEPLLSEEIDTLFEIKEAKRKLAERPIKHEDVMMFILQQYHGDNARMLALKDRLRVHQNDVSWTQRYYRPAREVLAPRYREMCEANILKLVEPMSADDIERVGAWDRLAFAEQAGVLTAVHA